MSLDPVFLGLKDVVLFAAGLVVFFFLPGLGVVQAFKPELSRGERVIFSWVIGYLLATGLYFVLGSLHAAFLFLPAVLILDILVLVFAAGQGGLRELKFFPENRWDLFCAVWLVVFVGAYWLVTHAWAHFDSTEGLRLYNDFYSDNLLGAAVAAEMKHTIPPENPLFAGVRLLYQYFPYIGLTIFSKILSIQILPLFNFLFPVFTKAMLFLSLVGVSQRIFDDPRKRLAAVAFTLWIGAVNKIGYEVGFSYFFWGLVFFQNYLKSGRRMNLILTAVLWGALITSLTMMALIVFAALIVYVAVFWKLNVSGRTRLVKTAILVFVSLGLWAILAYGVPSPGQGGGKALKFKSQVGHLVRESIQSFDADFYEFWLKQKKMIPKRVGDLLVSEPKSLRYLFVYGIWGVAWLAFLFNMIDFAAVGLVFAIVFLKRKRFLNEPALGFLCLAGVASILLPFLINPRETSGPVIFYQFGAVPLLFFSAGPVVDLVRDRNRWPAKLAVLILFVQAFSFHHVANFLPKESYHFYTLTSPDLLTAYRFLRDNTKPDDTILHPLIDETVRHDQDPSKNWIYRNHNYYLGILAERRSLFIHPTLSSTLTRPRLPGSPEERDRDIQDFFKSEDPAEILALTGKYDIRWVLVPRHQPWPAKTDGIFQPVFENAEVQILKRAEERKLF